jgi:hypothetical protein
MPSAFSNEFTYQLAVEQSSEMLHPHCLKRCEDIHMLQKSHPSDYDQDLYQ